MIREPDLIASRERAYLSALAERPDDLGALTQLAALFYATGRCRAGRLTYAHAASAHPDDPLARTNFGSALLDDGDADGACAHYAAALRIDPSYRLAHRGMAIAYIRRGDARRAHEHARVAFAGQPATASAFRGRGRARDVLLVVSAIGGNADVGRFLDDRRFRRFTLIAEFYDRNVALPSHHVTLNAIGDADRCRAALERAREILAGDAAPVVNAPDAVLRTSREENAARLGTIPGVVTPRMRCFPRSALCSAQGAALLARGGFDYPLLLRAPGFQNGRHFALVESAVEVPQAAGALPGDDVLAISFLNARGSDGCVRKYRMMTIGGRLYPLHLAVTREWKAHYFTSQTARDAAARGEESAFLASPSEVLGPAAVHALERIATALELQYGGIDFALDASGNVLLFEANATMIVPPPENDPSLAYRRPAVERIEAAIDAMLLGRGAMVQWREWSTPGRPASRRITGWFTTSSASRGTARISR